MGIGLYPVFKPELADVTMNTPGEAMGEAFEELETLAAKHGLVALSAFGDSREVPPGFDGDPEELAKVMGPSDEWFDPRKAKAAVEALVHCVENNADDVSDPEDVLDDLDELARVLELAAARGAQFRLEMA